MPTSSLYKIAHVGLKPGIYQFNYTINAAFFAHFNYEFSANGNIDVVLQLEKSSDQLFNLQFQINGKTPIECDRCLASLLLPIDEQYHVIVKMVPKLPAHSTNNLNEEDDLDILYITPDATHIDVAQLLYEFAILSIPQHASFPEDDYGNPTCPLNEDGTMPCNEKVLAILHQEAQNTDNQDDNNDDKDTPIDPRWAALRNLK
jgi:uncharacterized protein